VIAKAEADTAVRSAPTPPETAEQLNLF
jgi:hypothetical protein